MPISVREMDVFRRVMELGSVTAAATSLNISQPAVSRMLQHAEQRLGFRLFLRQKKRLLPTAEAQSLFAEVVNVFAAVQQARRLAEDLREGEAGVLSIAAVTGLGHNILPRAVHRFRTAHPEVAVVLQTATGPEVVARVAQGRADLGFSVGPAGHASIDSEILCSTPIGCVLPLGHPLAAKSVLEPDDIADQAIICPGPHLSIGAAILGAFAEANLRLRVAVETSQSTIACELVRTGVGIAILDGLGLLSAKSEELVTRPFRPAQLIAARILWPKERAMSRLANDFVADVRSVMKDVAPT